jgi:zinc transport system substrate-binding protein
MAHAAGALEVVCGIAPYTYLAERIGGSHVSVHTLIEQNQDPHTFEPSPRHVAALGRARMFLLSGLDFEERLSSKLRQSFPALIFADLSQGLGAGSGARECGHGDEHESQGEQHEADCDQHLWLSPPLYRAQAERVAQAFAKVDPVHKNDYYANLAAFQRELDLLAARIAKQLQPFHGRSFFVFHPAFAYFGEAFGLQQKAVEVGGRTPTPKTIASLIAAAREAGVRLIFVQPQFDQTSAKIVAAAIGGTLVGLDPLAKDVLHNYTVIAEQLERAFQ